MSHIAVVGAGLVGCSWAIVFAGGGRTVLVHDADPDIRAQVRTRIAASLADMHKAGLIDDPKPILARVNVCERLEQAVADAGYIQESAFERIDVKATVSAEIDRAMRPDATVGSSSSGIPASRFTEALTNRSRFLIVHPVNPPHLVPVVELVPAPWTDPSAVDTARTLMEVVGQSPMTVRRELEGFVLNRLQGALLREAWALYAEGYASADDIDRTVRDGLGLRWSFMGPFETIDLNAPGGIADYAHRFGRLYQAIAAERTEAHPWSEELIRKLEAERRESLPADQLGERGAWRNRRLMALKAHKRAVED